MAEFALVFEFRFVSVFVFYFCEGVGVRSHRYLNFWVRIHLLSTFDASLILIYDTIWFRFHTILYLYYRTYLRAFQKLTLTLWFSVLNTFCVGHFSSIGCSWKTINTASSAKFEQFAPNTSQKPAKFSSALTSEQLEKLTLTRAGALSTVLSRYPIRLLFFAIDERYLQHVE